MKSIIALSLALGIAGGLYAARRPAVRPVVPVARQDASAGLVGAGGASFASNGQPRDLGNSVPLPKWGPSHVSRSPLLRGNLPESQEGYQINHRAGEREVPIVR